MGAPADCFAIISPISSTSSISPISLRSPPRNANLGPAILAKWRSGCVQAPGTQRMPSSDVTFFGETADPAACRPAGPKNANSPSQVWHPLAEWPIRLRLCLRNPENANLRPGILWQNGDPAASMASGPRECQTPCQVWHSLGPTGALAPPLPAWQCPPPNGQPRHNHLHTRALCPSDRVTA